jgi:hypothetical protein
MRGSQPLERLSVRRFLAIYLASLGMLSAQEVEAPGGEGRSGSVFAPGGYVELTAPIQCRIGLNVYGFYLSGLKAPVGLIEVPIAASKFLTVTPGYSYFTLPVSGLNAIARKPGGFTNSYEEHQFRLDATFKFSVRNFEISDRNMYVRRFRPTNEINRYRNRMQVAHRFVVKGYSWKVFVFDEPYYEWGNGWMRNWASVGVNVPLARHVTIQPLFIRQDSKGLRGINYLLFGLIFSTK